MITINRLSSSHRLFVLQLLFGGDWVALKDCKPNLTKKQRAPLLDGGLIEEQKQGRSVLVRLTDRGWLWCSEHLHEPVSVPRNNAARILNEALLTLSGVMRAQGLSLAKLISMKTDCDEMEERVSLQVAGIERMDERRGDEPVASVSERIRDASLRLGQGRARVRVTLADLRSQLPEVSRDELDKALLHLEGEDRLQLMKLDNPLEIRKPDEEAMLSTPSGEPRHILYWIE